MLAEAFGRKDYPLAARCRYRVAACLFARAYERADPGSARADARGARDGIVPFQTVFAPFAGAAKRLDHGKLEKRRVAVPEPFSPEKLHFSDTAEILAVEFSQPRPFRVFADIARKCLELAVAFHDPIMPIEGEEMQTVGAVFGGTPTVYGAGKSHASARSAGPCLLSRFRNLYAAEYGIGSRLLNYRVWGGICFSQ